MKQEEYIHIPVKWILIWLGVLATLFITGCLLMNKRAKSLNYLSYDKQLDTSYVVNPISNRRGLFYDDYVFVVDACSELVENTQGYDDWKFYYEASPSHHQLGDLPGPYYMFKAAYNDTIVVIKGDYVLKFKMTTIIGLENQKINIGKYQLDINSKQVDCELKISSDSTYEIQLCYQATEDIVNCAILSYGHYSIANELLHLHDDFYNYDWEISLIDNVISVGRGYAFLNGKTIMKFQNETVEVLPPNDNFLARTRAQIDMFVTHQNNPQLVTGQYEGQNHEYLLRIDDIGRYQLHLKDVLLSEGVWCQQDSILILHDNQLNHDFKIAIGNDSLLSLGIPGEFGGTKFTLTN